MKKTFNKILTAGVAALASVALLTGCGTGGAGGGGTATPTTEDGRTVVTFWHSMGGVSGAEIDRIVTNFNNSQDGIEVRAYFQGEYEEALTTFHAIAGTAQAPAIMQVFDVGTMSIAQSGHIIPVQQFIDRDNHDISVIEASIISYYQIGGQFYSIPFNSSTPVMYINMDAFRAAGLDPYSPPATFEAIEEAARVIVDSTDGAMRGFALNAWGWMWEQLLANQGALLMNNNNGRTGTPTEVGYTFEEGYSILSWIARMVAEGTFANYGGNWQDMYAGFFAEDVAMIICSSASAVDMITNSPFEVGIAFMPHPANRSREGVVIGGASLWLVDHGDDDLHNAAWEFMKFVQRPEVQAQWHVGTGFLAINPAAYNEPVVIEAWEEMPQLRVTVDQLQATNVSYATQGAIMDMIPFGRTIIETTFEDVFNGGDPTQALNTATDRLNAAIEEANLIRGS